MAELASLIAAGGDGGGHKKVIIHVPLFVKHHHHKHTIVKHIHHKSGGGGGDDHYEVLGYTYGEPKPAPHFGGGKDYYVIGQVSFCVIVDEKLRINPKICCFNCSIFGEVLVEDCRHLGVESNVSKISYSFVLVINGYLKSLTQFFLCGTEKKSDSKIR